VALDTEAAAAFAIERALKRGGEEITPDDLLLGCLRSLSQFGIAQMGPWAIDLEALGVEWLNVPAKNSAKVAYSDAAVKIFDLAAQIAKSNGGGTIGVEHLLAAFAGREDGLMGEICRRNGITSAGWRAAVAILAVPAAPRVTAAPSNDYLSPEEAAESLGIHVQTLRGYVRSGKLPARRLAGERAIRIRRLDLEKLLEPLQE
jgi:excisionase family DNA binding protein